MNKGCALNQQKRDPKEKIDPNDQKGISPINQATPNKQIEPQTSQ